MVAHEIRRRERRPAADLYRHGDFTTSPIPRIGYCRIVVVGVASKVEKFGRAPLYTRSNQKIGSSVAGFGSLPFSNLASFLFLVFSFFSSVAADRDLCLSICRLPLSSCLFFSPLLLHSYFFSCFFDLGLYGPHTRVVTCGEVEWVLEREKERESVCVFVCVYVYAYMCACLCWSRVWRGRTMGTHVKTIGTQVYRIYRGADGGRPRRKNRAVASRCSGPLSMSFRSAVRATRESSSRQLLSTRVFASDKCSFYQEYITCSSLSFRHVRA